MLKRLLPPLLVVLSVLLDTAVLPLLLYGRYLVPVSLVVVILIGIQLGRMNGMLYGLIAGILLDVTAGTLGMKFLTYILVGFLIGFLLDQQPEISRTTDRKERLELLAIRAIWITVLLLLHEIVLLVYQYFSTAVFEWKYLRDLAIRVAIVLAACMLLYNPFRAMMAGGEKRSGGKRTTREVKHF